MSDFLKEIGEIPLNFPKNEDLHPNFWKGMKINSIFSSKLREIAQDIVESLEISKFLKDIVITGSVASYNWHSLSDIDLHILLDFEEIDENVELVSKFLHQKRINWNKAHKILLAGHEVEIYFQDIKEEHHSAGVYSLVQSRWLQKPVKDTRDYDLCAIKCKAESIERDIDMISYLFYRKEYRKSHELSQIIRDKVKKLRQSGLDSAGVHSVENLAFKVLRNRGKLTKLMALSTQSYDGMHSASNLNQIKIKVDKNV
tara:strand:+ start:173 stop:943 length:771 start_codon:yes stop_codon:yes gene_type:complete